MSDKCPECGSELACIGGCSAHWSNWYCTNETRCGWQAWGCRSDKLERSPLREIGNIAADIFGRKK